MLCNNASIQGGSLRGTPTEGAILAAASKNNMYNIREQYTRLTEIPFTSETKIMVVKCCHKKDDYRNEVYYVKGAFERVINKCPYYSDYGKSVNMDADREKQLLNYGYELGSKGLRVIGLCKGPSLEQLTFLGEFIQIV